MQMTCTIYARFSNTEQIHGDSKERQLRQCREMAARHGWPIVQEIIDEGRSAFTGINRAEGSGLWAFEQKVAFGEFLSGHVLLVENLDRISREGYAATLAFLSSMSAGGVTVATVDGDRVYRANEPLELAPVIEAVVKAELAREESAKKSQRLREAQQRKVAQAQAHAAQGLHIATTKIAPAWIHVDDEYRMTLHPERTALLREIFQLTIDGYGTPSIARRLNDRREPVWNNHGRRSNHGWTVGYLTKLVTSRTVLGEYQPMNRPRHGKATSKNIIVANHYPPAIDSYTFSLAQAARHARRNSSGSWQVTHANILSGLARCGSCGGRMKREVTACAGSLRRKSVSSKAYPARNAFSYLKCHNAINRVRDEGSGQLRCANRAAVRYENLERAIVAQAIHFAAARSAPASEQVTSAKIQLADADSVIAEAQRQLINLIESFARTGSLKTEQAVVQREAELIQLEYDRKNLQARLQDAEAACVPDDYHQRLVALKGSLESSDEAVRHPARVWMKQLLGQIISRLECAPSKETLLILGNEAVGIIFDGEGRIVNNCILQTRIFGPNGEPDWHPDQDLIAA